MTLKKRKPVFKLDNYVAYLSQDEILIPVKGIGDPLVHDILYMLQEADYRMYFEESFYRVLEWKIDTFLNGIVLKVEKENENDSRKV